MNVVEGNAAKVNSRKGKMRLTRRGITNENIRGRGGVMHEREREMVTHERGSTYPTVRSTRQGWSARRRPVERPATSEPGGQAFRC